MNRWELYEIIWNKFQIDKIKILFINYVYNGVYFVICKIGEDLFDISISNKTKNIISISGIRVADTKDIEEFEYDFDRK